MSNFWESSHCRRWLVPRTALPAGRDALIETTRWMVVLGCKARMRQRVIATAIVLLRRFALASGSDWDEYAPRAVGVACLYVAAKAEECPMQAKHWVRYASHHAGYGTSLSWCSAAYRAVWLQRLLSAAPRARFAPPH